MTTSMDGKKLVIIGGNSGIGRQIAANPAGRVGQPADISSAALLALTNPFLTGTTMHIDGGGRLA